MRRKRRKRRGKNTEQQRRITKKSKRKSRRRRKGNENYKQITTKSPFYVHDCIRTLWLLVLNVTDLNMKRPRARTHTKYTQKNIFEERHHSLCGSEMNTTWYVAEKQNKCKHTKCKQGYINITIIMAGNGMNWGD